jgi:hypothetical protein
VIGPSPRRSKTQTDLIAAADRDLDLGGVGYTEATG